MRCGGVSDWCEHADEAEPALSIVEDLKVFEDGASEFDDARSELAVRRIRLSDRLQERWAILMAGIVRRLRYTLACLLVLLLLATACGSDDDPVTEGLLDRTPLSELIEEDCSTSECRSLCISAYNSAEPFDLFKCGGVLKLKFSVTNDLPGDDDQPAEDSEGGLEAGVLSLPIPIEEIGSESDYRTELCSIQFFALAGDIDDLSVLGETIRALPVEAAAEANEREAIALRFERAADEGSNGISLTIVEIGDILGARCAN